jgi:hypothetical protein
MAKYRVMLIRADSLSIEVEADSEEAAVEEAFDEAPREMCAQCGGWGQKWGIDEGEWLTVDEWHGADYDAKKHGPTVQEA